MVKALINEPQADDLDAEQLGDQRVGIQFRPETVPCPEQRFHPVEKRVACAFERQILGQFVDAEPVLLEPITKMWLFGLAFGMEEPAENGLIAEDQIPRLR